MKAINVGKNPRLEDVIGLEKEAEKRGWRFFKYYKEQMYFVKQDDKTTKNTHIST
jgi:hypothetical protein